MIYISEEEVNALLNWPDIVDAVQQSLLQIHNDSENVVPPRTFMNIPESGGVFLSMPAYGKLQNIITCKLLSIYEDNWKNFRLPSHNGCIVVFNGENGVPLANIDAGSVTLWRTAAGSIVATKRLFTDDRNYYRNKTLAVLGAGDQGKYHILGFQNTFKFAQINLWNRTYTRRNLLAKELREKHQIQVEECETPKDCVQNADVIILTFAYCAKQFISICDLKRGALVIAVGFPVKGDVFGLCDDVYESAELYTEHVGAVGREMKVGVERLRLKFENISEAVSGSGIGCERSVVLYQSLGMALMDTAASKLVLEKYNARK